MLCKTLTALSLAAVLGGAALVAFGTRADAQNMPGMNMPAAPAGSASPVKADEPMVAHHATDVGNTNCPVSGEKVEASKLVEVYDGKVYHMCCSDCTAAFEKEPAKFAALVAADPAKYGVKK